MVSDIFPLLPCKKKPFNFFFASQKNTDPESRQCTRTLGFWRPFFSGPLLGAAPLPFYVDLCAALLVSVFFFPRLRFPASFWSPLPVEDSPSLPASVQYSPSHHGQLQRPCSCSPVFVVVVVVYSLSLQEEIARITNYRNAQVRIASLPGHGARR